MLLARSTLDWDCSVGSAAVEFDWLWEKFGGFGRLAFKLVVFTPNPRRSASLSSAACFWDVAVVLTAYAATSLARFTVKRGLGGLLCSLIWVKESTTLLLSTFPLVFLS